MSNFYCTFAIMQMEFVFFLPDTSNEKALFKPQWCALCLIFALALSREKNKLRGCFNQTAREVMLPVKILEGLSEQMKYFHSDVTMLWKNTNTHTDGLNERQVSTL